LNNADAKNAASASGKVLRAERLAIQGLRTVLRNVFINKENCMDEIRMTFPLPKDSLHASADA
jgi:hypothetical protein